MNRPLAVVTMVALFGATHSAYRFPAHKLGYHIGATSIIPSQTTSRGEVNLPLWLCSNESCPDKSKYQQGATCSSCSSPVQSYGFTESVRHMNAKDKAKNVKQAIEQGEAKILFSPETADEDLRKAIYDDMFSLASHEAGTGWGRLASMFTGNNTDFMLAQLLKALVDQNKILIRQNELMLRALKRPS